MQALVSFGNFISHKLAGQAYGDTRPAEHANDAPASSPPATVAHPSCALTRRLSTPASCSPRVDVPPTSRPHPSPPPGSRSNRQYHRPCERRPSDDELRLTRTFSTGVPPDALPIPTYTYDNWAACKMGRFPRPGDRDNNMLGMDTLSTSSHFLSSARTPKSTYTAKRERLSSPARPSAGSLTAGQRSFANAVSGGSSNQRGSPSRRDFHDRDGSPTKRRKTDRNSFSPVPANGVINLDGDDSDVVEVEQPPARSHHAAHKPQSQASSTSSFTPPSLRDAARKGPPRTNNASQPPPSSFETFNKNIKSAYKGRNITPPSPTKRKSAPPGLDDEVEIVDAKRHSKHPRTTSNGSCRINESTHPRRRGSSASQHSRTHPANLRDQFSRGVDSTSEDELAASRPTSGPSSRSRASKSPVLSRTKTVVKPPRPPPTASHGWPLAFFQTYGFKQHGLDLSLKRKPESTTTFAILKLGTEGSVIEANVFDLSLVRKAFVDDHTRVRLDGSMSNGRLYWFDVQFQDAEHFRLFRETHLKPVVGDRKVFTRESADMEALFARPREENHKVQDSQAIEDPEIQLLIKKVQNRSAPQDQRPARTLLSQRLQDTPYKSLLSRNRVAKSEALSRLGPPLKDAFTPSVRSTRSTHPRTYKIDDSNEEPEPVEKRVSKYSVDTGLGIPWKKPLSYNSGRHRTMVNFEDLVRLDEEEFLNDSLIDFYMTYLFDQTGISKEKVYFFNTHFYTTLTRAVPGQKGGINYAGVARWTSKIDIFSYDYIVVPINENAHWYLAIICNASNISRKPVNGFGESSPAAQTIPETPEPKVVDMTQDDPVQVLASKDPIEQEEIMLFDAEKKPAMTDEGHQVGEILHSGFEKISSRESPIAETAQMGQLTLGETVPKGILADTSSPSTAVASKTKRKPGSALKKHDLDQPIIMILDSFAGTHPRATRALKDYIMEEGKAKRNMDTGNLPSFYPREQHLPMQSNFTDCGVYLLAYTEKFFKNPRDFVSRLLSREMDPQTDWPDMSAPGMRNSMRKIIMGLHGEQNSTSKQERKEKKRTQVVEATKVKVPKEQKPATQPAELMKDHKPEPPPGEVLEQPPIELVEPATKAGELEAWIPTLEPPTPHRRSSPKVVIPTKPEAAGSSQALRHETPQSIHTSPIPEPRPKGTMRLPQAIAVVEATPSFEVFEDEEERQDEQDDTVVPESPEVVEFEPGGGWGIRSDGHPL
ncbi:hypothetical protein P154DRAFT_525182 [Amniculicola lignicola CBS 123094]|uniref:Ubiquitin-like protease family profile domain-containing protein n=1 Tax=Amniculicola lignicola CBS 123094 TaxID=1392246 RepID=A0A6A5W569_9PLEO|nr:hypothetical protein P154DRAFT_525182 [Amniculicola lignicola CBS 123094]